MAQTTALSEQQRLGGGEHTRGERSLWGMALRRLLKNRLALLGLVIVIAMLLIAIFAPLIRPYDPDYQNYNAVNELPSSAHWFGTDALGRDNFSRVITGISLSMVVGLGVAFAVFVLGAAIGGLAALGGRSLDNIVMRFTDIMYAFPDLLLVILIQAVFAGRSFPPPVVQVIFAISLVAWVTVARLIRGQMLSLKERDYVQAARALGATERSIVFKHLLPNTLSPVVIAITFAVPSAIFAEAALAFIGVGLPPPAVSLGRLVSEGRAYVQTNWSIIAFPALAISVLMLAFTFLGDGLRDALDPRAR